MDVAAIRQRVVDVFTEIIKEAESSPAGELLDDTILLDSGLDSLGFAILVARLEEELGWDPFTISEEAVYPRTFGEFVNFYAVNQP